MRAIVIPPGTRFHRLEVLHPAGSANQSTQSLCRCDCGEFCVKRNDYLRRGVIKSCGCLRLETNRRNGYLHKHGQTDTPTWNSWQAMLRRCKDPKNKDFHSYGGRGVKVTPAWDPSAGGCFENFLADMGERPQGTTLDKDKLGGIGCLLYSPDTCCWLTPKEQAMHTRRRLASANILSSCDDSEQ